MALQQQLLNVDPNIWLQFARDSFTVPKLHSRVYYFPPGHLEHSPITPTTQTLSLLRPFILCTVSSVDLLADPQTDQIFAKLLLTPVIDATVVPPVEVINEQDNADHVVSSAKTLTTTDANNACGFSVPKACSVSIFPPLDLTTPWPSQELSITDVCGVVWTFNHVYRGNPKRYLFTTGWSAFVDKKTLVGGDTLVFIKNSTGNIFVGIRRQNAAKRIIEKNVVVANAVELAGKNTPFEVMCYPTIDGFDFVVEDKVVEDAMRIHWYPGMRVTHTVKGGSTFHGTISAISYPSTHPWRTLQVEWNEPNVSENLKHVSPWQVEPDFSTPLLHQLFPPTKRLRAAQESALLSDTERISSISKVEFSNFLMKSLNQTPLDFDGMLGVRQNHILGSNSCNSLKGSSFEKSSTKETDNVSNEINTTNHIILFGQIVRPAEKSFNDSAIKRADGREMHNEVDDSSPSFLENC
ncbi:auxin response factor 17-like [Vicia villosa]|uniref:auxin response factor 17-like n=1 Tax=Vicia villosa TaxID=3911 RepID=UPI00273B297D|nr:auxin response factor 17-like [Vicia villosa]XP_058746578.1 auxin response factor 17-like [Vicia villosa]